MRSERSRVPITPTHTVIRRATAQDADSIAAVLYDAFLPYRDLYTEAAFAATCLVPSAIVARMAEATVWVALADDVVVGTVSASARGQDVVVRSLAVVPCAARHGIGERLLAHAEAFGWDAGQERIVLNTTPFLTAAIAFYERRGFTRVDCDGGALYGTPLLTMVKPLVPPHKSGLSCATQYAWAAGGHGWRLLDRTDVSVIFERMEPLVSERRHFHARSLQFFYICSGSASLTLARTSVVLGSGEGIAVPPGVPHVIRNTSDAPTEFLVVSCPSTQGDRFNVADPP